MFVQIGCGLLSNQTAPFPFSPVQIKKLQEMEMKPKEQVTLEPYERDHAMVVGLYRPAPKKKE